LRCAYLALYLQELRLLDHVDQHWTPFGGFAHQSENLLGWRLEVFGAEDP